VDLIGVEQKKKILAIHEEYSQRQYRRQSKREQFYSHNTSHRVVAKEVVCEGKWCVNQPDVRRSCSHLIRKNDKKWDGGGRVGKEMKPGCGRMKPGTVIGRKVVYGGEAKAS